MSGLFLWAASALTAVDRETRMLAHIQTCRKRDLVGHQCKLTALKIDSSFQICPAFIRTSCMLSRKPVNFCLFCSDEMKVEESKGAEVKEEKAEEKATKEEDEKEKEEKMEEETDEKKEDASKKTEVKEEKLDEKEDSKEKDKSEVKKEEEKEENKEGEEKEGEMKGAEKKEGEKAEEDTKEGEKKESELTQKFMFNIADGGFTELHTLWANEQRALQAGREHEVWHRRHDYWLLTGIVTYPWT